MEVLEQTLPVSLDEFLSQPLFCFFAQRGEGGPRVSPLWFLWEDKRLWHVAQLDGRSYPERVRTNPQTAAAIVDFEPSAGRVHHVGLRGTARLRPFGRSRAERLFEKYLGEHRTDWPERFRGLDSDAYRLIELTPETVVARDQSYTAPGDERDSGANC